MIVGVLGVLDGVLDQFDQRFALADELDKLRDATAAAKHGELFLLKQEVLNGAALLLVQELLDLHVSSTGKKAKLLGIVLSSRQQAVSYHSVHFDRKSGRF